MGEEVQLILGSTEHLDLTTPCFIATRVNSEGRATRNAERYQVHWEAEYGPVPKGLDLDHQCHNVDPTCTGGRTCRHRACYNVKHIILDTRANNLARGLTYSTSSNAVRSAKTREFLAQPDVKQQFSENGTADANRGYAKPGALDPIQCEHCPKVLKGTRAYGYHLTVVHKVDRSVKCDLCGRRLPTPYRLQRHRENCRKVRR